jgi:hypothetical protein
MEKTKTRLSVPGQRSKVKGQRSKKHVFRFLG